VKHKLKQKSSIQWLPSSIRSKTEITMIIFFSAIKQKGGNKLKLVLDHGLHVNINTYWPKGIIDLLQHVNVCYSALHDQNVRTSQDSSNEGSGKKGGLLSRPFGFGWNDKNKVINFVKRSSSHP
jgi:hypothetical protein